MGVMLLLCFVVMRSSSFCNLILGAWASWETRMDRKYFMPWPLEPMMMSPGAVRDKSRDM